jgi:hypothetical protein
VSFGFGFSIAGAFIISMTVALTVVRKWAASLPESDVRRKRILLKVVLK